MIPVLVAAAICGATPAWAAAPAPEDLYREASAAWESGDLGGAEKRLDEFRKLYADHRLIWPANMLWARCAADPAEAERRFRLLAQTAPPETRKDCDLEVAHLLLIRARWADAEGAYAAFLSANPADERTESAGYWRAVCLRELGRKPEALAAADAEFRGGRQGRWRAQAGLLAASLRESANDRAGAHAAYVDLSQAPWAVDLKPQALLGAAKTTADSAERDRDARALIKGWPDLPESDEARKLVNEPAPERRRWVIQVGAFAQSGNAAAERRKWTKKDRKVVVVKRRHPTFGELYFVYLGPYPAKDQADRAARALRKEGTACRVAPF